MSEIEAILAAHDLPPAHTISQPSRGSINDCFLINNTCFLRIDKFNSSWEGRSRYFSEQIAYNALREKGVPVPEVIALDVSKTVVDHDYILLTALPGTPLIDVWQDLSPSQQESIGHRAGEYLAIMHSIPFERFGELANHGLNDFDSWPNLITDFTRTYADGALAHQGLDERTHRRIVDHLDGLMPAFAAVKTPLLVHSDFQFENILVENGQITGIIDFEWALAGDPTWDFQVAGQWEDECPGSRQWVYQGYQTHRALDEHHATKTDFYILIRYLDNVYHHAQDGVDYSQDLQKVRTQLDLLDRYASR